MKYLKLFEDIDPFDDWDDEEFENPTMSKLSMNDYLEKIKDVGVHLFVEDDNNFELLKKVANDVDYNIFEEICNLFLDEYSLSYRGKQIVEKYIKFLKDRYPEFSDRYYEELM